MRNRMGNAAVSEELVWAKTTCRKKSLPPPAKPDFDFRMEEIMKVLQRN